MPRENTTGEEVGRPIKGTIHEGWKGKNPNDFLDL